MTKKFFEDFGLWISSKGTASCFQLLAPFPASGGCFSPPAFYYLLCDLCCGYMLCAFLLYACCFLRLQYRSVVRVILFASGVGLRLPSPSALLKPCMLTIKQSCHHHVCNRARLRGSFLASGATPGFVEAMNAYGSTRKPCHRHVCHKGGKGGLCGSCCVQRARCGIQLRK